MTTVFVLPDSSHNSLKLRSICTRITCFSLRVPSCSTFMQLSWHYVLSFIPRSLDLCVRDCFVVVHYGYDHMQAPPCKLDPSRWACCIISMWTMYYFTCTVSTQYILCTCMPQAIQAPPVPTAVSRTDCHARRKGLVLHR